MKHQRQLLITVLATTALLVPAAVAETVFEATLSGAAAGTDSPGTGTVVAVLNDGQTELAYEIAYSGLQGVEVAAHFHNAPPGESGPVVEPLPAENPKVGTWMISPEMVTELTAGNIYVNIHTDLHPGGEIAGWLEATSVPVERTTLSQVRALFR